MAINFLNHLNLNDNQLTNAKVHVATSAPTGAAGQIYFHSNDNKLRYYDNSGWKDIATGTTSLDIDAYTALGSATLHQTQDHFVFSDNGDEKKITFSDLEDSIFANVSGDATIAAGGALTIANGSVENAMLAGSIANAKLSNSSVSYGGVSLSLGGSDSTPAFDLTDATNYPTSSLSGTITNAQLAGSIANSKLANSAITIDGTSTSLGGSITTNNTQLSNEQVQDIVGQMVTGNTESGITVTYQDGDGTLDFEVGTLNQNTTGSAATLTTERNIQTNLSSTSAVAFDGSSDIDPGVTGTLALGNGGTGQTSAAAAASALLNVSQGGALTIGDGSDTITIPGDLVVTGDTTTNNVTTVTTSNGVVFEGTTADGHDATLKSVVAGADVTYTLPNVTGHVALFAADPSTTTISSTPAELNVLDGITASTAELNIMDGVTATTSELNIMDGVTATTSELNIMDGVTATTSELNILDGVTSTAAELNVLDGYTGSVTELNYLDSLHGTGVTAAEFDYLDGVSSNIQTQLDGKQATITGAATTIDGANLTASRAVISNASGKVAVSAVTSTELGYLDGVTSNIQTQLDARQTNDEKVSVLLEGGAATEYTVNHGLNSALIKTTVLDYGNGSSGATYAIVYPEVSYSDANNITVTFGSAPGASQDYVVMCEKMPGL